MKSIVWNSSTSACKCDVDCKNGEHLKNYERLRSHIDDLVVTFGEIKHTPETGLENRNTT